MTDELDELAADLFRRAREERPHPSVREYAARAVLVERRATVRRVAKRALTAAALAAGVVLALRATVDDLGVQAIDREPSGPSAPKERPERLTVNPHPDLPAPAVAVERSKGPSAPSLRGAAPPQRAPTLAEEVALLEEARSALERGFASEALTLLNRYEARAGAGRLATEAAVLRIEALALSGRDDEVRRLADLFLRDHPNSPLADRVRRLATGEGPTPGSNPEGPQR